MWACFFHTVKWKLIPALSLGDDHVKGEREVRNVGF